MIVVPKRVVGPRYQSARLVSCRAGTPVRAYMRTRPTGDRKRFDFSDESANSTWVHVATFGAWKGHPAGEFEFTREVFDSMVANFERRQAPIPFKYEHPPGDGTPAPSSGRVVDLVVKDDGLYALTVFTSEAAEMIRAGAYTYCSGVFVFDSIDGRSGEEIGPELFEIGLTDSPFIDDLHPIELR